MWDLGWTQWQCGSFFCEYVRIPLSVSFQECHMLIHLSPTLYDLSDGRRRCPFPSHPKGGLNCSLLQYVSYVSLACSGLTVKASTLTRGDKLSESLSLFSLPGQWPALSCFLPTPPSPPPPYTVDKNLALGLFTGYFNALFRPKQGVVKWNNRGLFQCWGIYLKRPPRITKMEDLRSLSPW